MKVRYTVRALQDLRDALAYIDEQSPQGSRRVQARIQEVIEIIARNPEVGVVTGRRALRRLTAHPYPYLIFYRVEQDSVVIFGIRRGARDPKAMPR